jgi:hypothetical protein
MSATNNGNAVGGGDEPMDQEDPAEAEPSAEYNNSAPVGPPDRPSNSSNGESISRKVGMRCSCSRSRLYDSN